MTVTARDINLRAAEILMEKDWCQGYYADSFGHDPLDPDASAFCMAGAQIRAFSDLTKETSFIKAAESPLRRKAMAALQLVVATETDFSTWKDANDDPSTTKEDCILWLKKAAEISE
jgi:hypothetical protein